MKSRMKIMISDKGAGIMQSSPQKFPWALSLIRMQRLKSLQFRHNSFVFCRLYSDAIGRLPSKCHLLTALKKERENQ